MARALEKARGLARWGLRHPGMAAFLLALAVRVVVALVIFVGSDGLLFDDDERFFRLAGDLITGEDDGWDRADRATFTTNAAFILPVAAIRSLADTPLGGQLFSSAMGAIAAGGTAYLATRLLGSRFGLVAGAIVALLPSQVLWSSLVLKDAWVWALSVGIACAFSGFYRRAGRESILWMGLLIALLLLLGRTRAHSLLVALIAASLAGTVIALARHRSGDWTRTAIVLVAAAVIPLLSGMGLGGADFLRRTSVEDTREATSKGGSAVVKDVDRSTDSGIEGHVEHLPEGLAVILLRPFPWEESDGIAMTGARLETVLWYPILGLAGLGAIVAARRRSIWFVFPALQGTGLILVYALAEGNLGTAYRHRGELVWIVALFAAAGVSDLVSPESTGEGRELERARI